MCQYKKQTCLQCCPVHLLFAWTAILFWNVPLCSALLCEPGCSSSSVLVSLSLQRCCHKPWARGTAVLTTVSLFSVYYKVFIHSAHAYITMPYLEVTHKRIMRSRRNAFVKWIISDWQGFCQNVDTPNISFKYWCTFLSTKYDLGLSRSFERASYFTNLATCFHEIQLKVRPMAKKLVISSQWRYSVQVFFLLKLSGFRLKTNISDLVSNSAFVMIDSFFHHWLTETIDQTEHCSQD